MYCSQCGTQNSDEFKFCHNCGNRLSADAVAVSPEYAAFWRRFLAYVVDRLLLSIPSGILAILFFIPSIMRFLSNCCSIEGILFSVISFLFGWIWFFILIVTMHLLYFVWFESSHFQATPGKLLLGIIVTDIEGRRISFFRSLGRNLGKIISHMVLNIGFILAGLTPRKQALHDMLADCLVVMRK
ncbi:zinc-ribbon domain-containing protein [candidate division KSB1 bacterium]|nr:MAG: zinc-ribbon domain-containing protein [candidate division KSB1 bacterium]